MTLTDQFYNKTASVDGDYCPTQEQAMYDEMEDEMTAEEMEAAMKAVVDFEHRHGLVNTFWDFNPYWAAVWAAERC